MLLTFAGNKLLVFNPKTFTQQISGSQLKNFLPFLHQLPALVSLSTCASTYLFFLATPLIYFLS